MKLLMKICLTTLFVFSSMVVRSSTALANGDNLPLCQDEKLIYDMQNKIDSYLAENPNNSVREKRRRSLLMKNLHNFEEKNPADIDRKVDFLLASRFVTLKINEGLLDGDFRICQSSGAGKKYKIFLLIYRNLDKQTVVEIINFLPPEKSGEVFDFIY